jgi:seryl-tRNA synthetase
MGHLDQAFQAVKRLSASFDRQVAQWENLARKKEQNKQKLSMQQLRKMIAEHSGVRTRVQLVKTQVQRLRTSLDQLTNLMQRQAVTPPGPSDPEQAADAIARDRHSP